MKKLSYAVILFFILCTLCGCGSNGVNTADFNNVTQVPQIEQVSDAESKDMREQITDEPKETDENSINTEEVVTADPISEEPECAFSYIANKHTKKFHNPDCHSVDEMKESNKKYLNCTRSEAIARGYSPCGNCNP